MPKYRLVTEQVTKRAYEETMTLPVDMGEATSRLTDRMMRAAAENDALKGSLDSPVYENAGEEIVVAIFRDDKQIWPRKRKAENVVVKATTKEQITFNAAPLVIETEEEEEA